MRKSDVLWVVLALLIAACGTTNSPEVLINQGEELYIRNCARCHQQDGHGYPNIYPPLAGNPAVLAVDPAPIVHVVQYGQGSMPPFRNSLSAEEIASIVSYIRNAWGNDASAVPPKQAR